MIGLYPTIDIDPSETDVRVIDTDIGRVVVIDLSPTTVVHVRSYDDAARMIEAFTAAANHLDTRPQCEGCETRVARVFPRLHKVGEDGAGVTWDTRDLCKDCAGVSDDDIAADDETINFRAAS